MKKILILFASIFIVCISINAQIDKEQLAITISNADAANNEKLKEFIWKRKSEVSVSGELKLTTITEFSFDEKGELQAKIVDAASTVDQKPGIRGQVQKNAAEEKLDYVQKALQVATAYTFMSKGQLLDFFSNATVTVANGVITAVGEDVYLKGDKLTVVVDEQTNLYISKNFSSFLDKDPLSGEIKYAKFSSGINHGSETILKMPAQNMQIDAKNQDYSQRVK